MATMNRVRFRNGIMLHDSDPPHPSDEYYDMHGYYDIYKEHEMHTSDQLKSLIKALEANSDGSLRVNMGSAPDYRANIRHEFNTQFGPGSSVTGVLEFLMDKIARLEQEVQFLKMHSKSIAGPVAADYYEQKTTTPENCPHKSSFVLKY